MARENRDSQMGVQNSIQEVASGLELVARAIAYLWMSQRPVGSSQGLAASIHRDTSLPFLPLGLPALAAARSATCSH